MNRKTMVIALAMAAFGAVAGFAQTAPPDRVTVPLTDPAKPALVRVEVMTGSITVTGYEGKEVIVEATAREKALTGVRRSAGHLLPPPPVPPEPPVPPRAAVAGRPEPAPEPEEVEKLAEREYRHALARVGEFDEQENKKDEAKKVGLKPIPLASSALRVEEDDNRVTVEVESSRRAYDLVIKVPAGSSLKLETVNLGEIRVENVNGEVEAENTNGAIRLQNVSGTVVASTNNGDIEAVLSRLAPDKPMSFATFNGDVDLTLPADARASLRLKSQEGDVYSDFEMSLKTAPVRTEESGKSTGRFRVEIERAALATINGGGVEMKVETYIGNIYIRKKK